MWPDRLLFDKFSQADSAVDVLDTLPRRADRLTVQARVRRAMSDSYSIVAAAAKPSSKWGPWTPTGLHAIWSMRCLPLRSPRRTPTHRAPRWTSFLSFLARRPMCARRNRSTSCTSLERARHSAFVG
ncbi:hypothetical protein pneo_cds_1074 [Pandoravirus neocaledonia]|uniref:Uncharacterized protein n=1 Tax=Pandoravirus neocaledonia TaxID=2107708 RepID=A0A2U7UDY8_9VIRU|nr:hypothetical protein pneo_cds_1074 [Pandoravirus neocaledonia]AVK76681.1 hypothetical protein pneo_cds_1074 [Pandoravirus neocaledonia]